jgi:CheY-like chemotaxis protein
MDPIRRVLVVEDEPDVREPVAQLLAVAGFEVAAAANGLEALRLARSSPPDVIVLDLMMPVMNGWEFRRAQRADPALAAIPVVVVSASTPTPDLGPISHVAKPYELPALLRALDLVAGAREPAPLSGSADER